MKFTVYGRPVPQGSMRAFRHKTTGAVVSTSDNKKLKPWRQAMADTVFVESGCIPYCGDGKEAIAMSLDFFFAKPPSAKKRVNVTVKPDVDKLVRACLDAMKGILYGDDSQVVAVTARKHYGLPERVEIETDEL